MQLILYLEKKEFREEDTINLLSATFIHSSSYLLLIKKENKEEYERAKKEILEFLVKNNSNYFRSKKDEINQYLCDLKDYLRSYLGSLGMVREIEMRLSNRGIFGVNSTFGQIPFEVGLYMHPYFNIPYIPASSIKGAVSNAYYNLLISKGSNNNEAMKECKKIFGNEYFAGLISFTDALPIKEGENGYILYPDIINPHYKNVKNEIEVSPVPLIHLTVAPGTIFKFFVYIRKERKTKKELREIKFIKKGEISKGPNDVAEKPEPRMESLGYIDLAILYSLALGIGAKTSLGYSSFEVIKYE
jgi:CRISPR-associated protein Cmr6